MNAVLIAFLALGPASLEFYLLFSIDTSSPLLWRSSLRQSVRSGLYVACTSKFPFHTSSLTSGLSSLALPGILSNLIFIPVRELVLHGECVPSAISHVEGTGLEEHSSLRGTGKVT